MRLTEKLALIMMYASILVLAGCASFKPQPEEKHPYQVCYGGKDSDGDNVLLCSPATEDFVREYIHAPILRQQRQTD